MAKILILRFQFPVDNDVNVKGCYFESLIGDLEKNGNEIMWLNTFQSLYYKENSRKFKKWIESFIPKIKEFNPDIIFTFNNTIFEEIIKVTNCPILLYEADLVEFFAHKEYIKKYIDRYYITLGSLKNIETYKQLGFTEDKMIKLHPTTSIKRENKEKVNNISFIGSCFPRFNKKSMTKILSNDKNNLYGMYLEYWNNHNYNYEELCQKYIPEFDIQPLDYYKLLDPRRYILMSVLDLGLKLYGVNWESLPTDMLPLVAAFDKTPVYSLEHNQDIYNSSHVNLSINHPQCVGDTFPWRVYDIMASSGVLVSSYAQALKDYTKGYVDIPMYESPYEARDLCKKMLNEPTLREDIILASNAFIEKFGKWQTNFEKIEEYTGVKITNNDGNGSVIDVDYILNIPRNMAKSRIKSVFYSTMYGLSQIPGIYELYGKMGREKLYRGLLKYNKELDKYLYG